MINVIREYTKNVEDDMITLIDDNSPPKLEYHLTMFQAHDLLKKLERALRIEEIS